MKEIKAGVKEEQNHELQPWKEYGSRLGVDGPLGRDLRDKEEFARGGIMLMVCQAEQHWSDLALGLLS